MSSPSKRDGERLNSTESAIAALSDMLRSHPDVRNIRIATRRTASGAEQLLAWYQPAAPETDPSGLRRHLLHKLELRNRPARLLAVDDVDSAALAPERPRPALATAYRAPSTSVEQEIADTWAELLGVEEVGADDDFYELGGDSLVAVEAVVRLAPVLDPHAALVVPIELVFLEHGTPATVASALEAAS